ncbi:MAG: hypothetical protein J0G29_06845 [Alphaproteobacteria bacterium]|nr:hypothetical protein [Alphaproteobacteria bacterium]OJV44937.1 MAG: hypothetical protein BGO28_05940 [Alphaproteobacteria bacterium 43-37]
MKIRTLILTTVISASILSSQAQASGFGDIFSGIGTLVSGATSVAIGAAKLPVNAVQLAYNHPKITAALAVATISTAYVCHLDPTFAPAVCTTVMGSISAAGTEISTKATLLASHASALVQPYMSYVTTAQAQATSAFGTVSSFVKSIPGNVEAGFTAFDTAMIAAKDAVVGAATTASNFIGAQYAVADAAARTSATVASSTLSSVANQTATMAAEVASDPRAQAGFTGLLGGVISSAFNIFHAKKPASK